MSKISSAMCLAVMVLYLNQAAPMSAQRDLGQPCTSGLANCPSDGAYEHAPAPSDPSRVVTMLVRESHRGPFAHHWIELDTSEGPVTLHFGPATIPFIDLGQISLLDGHGGLKTEPSFHFLAEHYNYGKAPGSGRIVGKPLYLTIAQADALVEKERHRKFIAPYIPIFHDCRTFVCSVRASIEGKSSLPCYLLLKGYW